jgi:hypothetical protein
MSKAKLNKEKTIKVSETTDKELEEYCKKYCKKKDGSK